MLHFLPNEVLRVITDKLNFRDKLNLCKTCRILYDRISKTNLYETLTIRKNTEDIIRLFQDKILDGSQVKILEIPIDHLSDELYSSLVDIFPGVTRAMTSRHYMGSYIEENKKRADHITRPLLQWKNTLKKYDSVEDWKYFKDELFCSTFPQLEALDFFRSAFVLHREVGFDPLFLSKGITNAPMLTQLHLQYCDISIDSLEEIHKGCPHIRSLKLNDIMLVIDNTTLPVPISPANSVLYMELNAACFDKNGLFLDYIISKYQNLNELVFKIYNYDVSEIQEMLTDYYPDYDALAEEVAITDFFEEMLKQELICRDRLRELQPTIEAYKYNNTSFVSQLPKSIKVLKLQLEFFENVIEQLSKANIALSSLKLSAGDPKETDIKSLEADQLGFIKNQHLLKFLYIPVKSSLQTCGLSFISETVTTLDMRLINGGFYISWIISMFPSLESLKIHSREYLLSKESEEGAEFIGEVYPKLRKLDLGSCLIKPTSLKYIKRALPSIVELEWAAYYDSEYNCEFTYNLDFTEWNLTKLSIITKFENNRDSNCYLYALTPKRTEKYLQKVFLTTVFPTKDNPHPIIKTPRLNLVCNHIVNFSVDNKKVDL